MGFMNALMDVIKREKPDHLAVAFDKGGSDYRYEMYQEYKAHRDETPEAIKIAGPYIQAVSYTHLDVYKRQTKTPIDYYGYYLTLEPFVGGYYKTGE